MIKVKNSREIGLMREAGKIAAGALRLAGSLVKEGAVTRQIDRKVHDFIVRHNAEPSFLGYNGFPASLCISINAEIIHGIPSERAISYGDLVKMDVGAYYKGYHGDCADTFWCGDGEMPETVAKLYAAARGGFKRGAAMAVHGGRVGDISEAIQAYAEGMGFSVVRQWTGHGIGANLHEEPEVPNFGTAGKGLRLCSGMTIAIEPMINEGVYNSVTLDDKWTVVTADGKLSAHYENTVLIREGECEILTVSD